MLTSPRPVVAVAVMQAVRDQLSQACLPPPVRPPADREPPDGPEPRTPSVQERDVQLRQTWLSRTGSLDVLHVVYQHSGFPEPLEYRVEMDLQVEDSAEPETFAGAVEGEARLIIEEINTCVDESLLAMLIRVRGQLCWGAVLS